MTTIEILFAKTNRGVAFLKEHGNKLFLKEIGRIRGNDVFFCEDEKGKEVYLYQNNFDLAFVLKGAWNERVFSKGFLWWPK